MKTSRLNPSALTLFMLLLGSAAQLHAQDTAFSYQGRLNDGGGAANGRYDLRFAIYDALANGTVAAGPLTNPATGVTNGLFTVTLDFGGGVFTGADRWLEIGVRTNGGGAFSTLAPRQLLTPSPYALYAPSAGVAAMANGVAASSVGTAALVTGAVDSSRIADGSIAAGDLNPTLAFNTFWRQAGNAGTTPGTDFLGTTDNQALEIRVNGARALRLEPNTTSPNVISGYSGNIVSNGFYGAVIAGGGDSFNPNRVGGHHATVLGGAHNTAIGQYSTAMGGVTTASGNYSTAMGFNTTAGGIASLAAGAQARANHGGSFVWADSQFVDFASTANNQFLVRASGGVGIGTTTPVSALEVAGTVTAPAFAGPANQALEIKVNGARALRLEPNATSPNVIGGYSGNIVSNGFYGAVIAGGGDNGYPNRVGGHFAAVLGGQGNTAGGDYSTAMGFNTTASGLAPTAMGRQTTASGNHSTAMGRNTTASGESSTAMGYVTTASGYCSFATGRSARANHDGSFVWADVQFPYFDSTANNQFLIRASGGVGINTNNPNGAALSVNGEIRWGNASVLSVDQSGSIELGNSLQSGVTPYIDFHYGTGTAHDYNVRLINNANGTLSCEGNFQATTLTPTSDRNLKENFAPVDAKKVLAKVAALPLTEWNFKTDTGVRHVGPMAQDFYAAFGLGFDDKHISTVDADGVALAAIQGLNEKVENGKQKAESRMEKLEAENAELKQRLERLETLLAQQIGGAQ